MPRSDLRNIAIIAHVDHGKTSLVDCLLRQSGQFRENQLANDLVLDSNDLERERGITILSKNIALPYRDTTINIIDTPGHADFGGEVERVLQMADGALLLVDAFEGPRPQTRFVLQKALAQNLSPLVVINKIDRPDSRPDDVLSETFDLMVELGADDQTLDFPYIFTSARDGYATHDATERSGTMQPLFELIHEKIPPPEDTSDQPLQLRATTIEWSEFVGSIVIGRITAGVLDEGQKVVVLKEDGVQAQGNVTTVELFDKLGRRSVTQARSGDIVAVQGLDEPAIGDTIADPTQPKAMARLDVDEPTLSMVFTPNTSPLAGQEGQFVTGRHLRARLAREVKSNVALRVKEAEGTDTFTVSGRGILHLAILIEQMRREGYELSVSKPEVIRREVDGQWHEPFERLEVDVPPADVGPVMELVGTRRGQIIEMNAGSGGQTHIEFSIPARGLIGLRTRLMNATRGEAIMHHRFENYQKRDGEVPRRKNGVLVSQSNGQAVGYAIWKLQDRAELFVPPGEVVYEGMIVGENSRDNDMVVNPTKEKKLTNVRAAGSDDNILLKPPRQMTLEMALEYIEGDEFVEVTPGAIRLRKIHLTENARKRNRMI
ncbi:MAG: translational GTPase TypA [Planctomycetota bacterium]|nr:translational GTPase TypA [Planctomycetota bacterium]